MSKLWLIKNWGSEILYMPLGLFVISLSFGSLLNKVNLYRQSLSYEHSKDCKFVRKSKLFISRNTPFK